MARPEQLDSLLRHAQMQEQQAQSRWHAAQQQLERHRQQLSELQNYLSDYGPAHLGGGVAASVLLNHSRFSERLRDAIEQQSRVVRDAREKTENLCGHWQHKRYRVEALNVLKEKRAKQQAVRVTRLEQRSLDDFALRSLSPGLADA